MRNASGFGGGGFGFGFGLGLGESFLALKVGFAAAAFLDFVMLLSHISLLCELDSVVYRDEYEDLAMEHQRDFLRARNGVFFRRV